MTLTKGLIKADMIAARQAIDYYEESGNRNIKNIAAYHFQQAVVMMLRSQLE